jgi:hypothetical protein
VAFYTWLLEYQDAPGDLGLIARAVWQDSNNGCSIKYPDKTGWAIHFASQHPKTGMRLIEMLEEAYKLYALSEDK